ncbi:MAG: signal recognition particle-docking protein FtsY [Desulfobulbaceae bacterium]|nr:signal recognition particle-docking protein FtsY [Desulfobulbaceae bacterium]
MPIAELEETVAEAVDEKVDAAVIPIPDEREKTKSILHEDEGGFFNRLKTRLSKSRGSLVKRVDELFLGKKVIDQELLDDLEEILITADLGISTTQELVNYASDKVARKELSDPSALKKVLREKITEYLLSSDQPAELVMPESGPFIIMVVGVNGVGKTTTIGKMARKFVRSGQSVALVAADTFRAAAIEQLQIWGERIGVEVISQKFGSDPSSVVFDALAVARNFDVVIIDTAGRLHTEVNLMEELKKIKRVAGKKLEGAPHEVLLVLDATTGQNGISQARLFNEAVGVTGLALTKLDGTAKGGIVVNVCREINIPIRFIGIGEQMDDLRDFDPNEFAEALFAEDNGEDGELNFE